MTKTATQSSERLAQIVPAALAAIHEVLERHRVTEQEWHAVLDFLTDVGNAGEFVLLSDVTRTSVLIDALSHDAGEDVTASDVEGPLYVADPPWREAPVYWGAQFVGGVVGGLAIWAVFAHTGMDLGMGQTSFNQDTTPWASAIFAEGIGTALLMFAILGIVDSRSPGDFAGIVIGGVVVAIIMVIGPVTGASLNPARAFGPELVSAIGGGATHWNQYLPVYLLPGLVGSGLGTPPPPREMRRAGLCARHGVVVCRGRRRPATEGRTGHRPVCPADPRRRSRAPRAHRPPPSPPAPGPSARGRTDGRRTADG